MNLAPILPAFILPAIELLFFTVLFLQRDRGSDEPGVTLRSRWICVVGGVSLVLGTLMLVASADEPQARLVEVMLIAQLFYLPGIPLIYGGLMTYIHLPDDADYFLCRTFLGRIYHVRYADCHGYKIEEDKTRGGRKEGIGISVRATVQTPKGSKKDKTFSLIYCWAYEELVDQLKKHGVRKEKKRRKK